MKGWTSIYSNRPNPSLVPKQGEPPAALPRLSDAESEHAGPEPGRRRDVPTAPIPTS
jgi:hypothetical protein